MKEYLVLQDHQNLNGSQTW